MERFRDIGAVWEFTDVGTPHVKTSLGGSHVDKYFNSDVVVASPLLTAEIVESVLVPELRQRHLTPDWIVGYAPFGLFLAYAAADALGARCAYSDPGAEYDTYFDIRPTESVLVIADDMFSGRSVVRTIEKLEARRAKIMPTVFCLVNHSGRATLGEREILAVGTLATNIYAADACPLCSKGSSALAPRPNWDVFSAAGPRAPLSDVGAHSTS
jgi:orotate phosphoribosyltransferase